MPSTLLKLTTRDTDYCFIRARSVLTGVNKRNRLVETIRRWISFQKEGSFWPNLFIPVGDRVRL